VAVEQVNGQMKGSASFFDKKIRLDQIGLADLICHSSYLLQNFKRGFIQQHDAETKSVHVKQRLDGTVERMMVFLMLGHWLICGERKVR
jgi:hypothetical protein